jgi:hypothetical protein
MPEVSRRSNTPLYCAKHVDSRASAAFLLEMASYGSNTTMTALSDHEPAAYQA